MAAYTKGTQTSAGLAKKPDWLLRSQARQAQSLERQRTANEAVMSAQGFTKKTDLGNGMMQYTRPDAGGSVGSSFGKMMGGSPRMGGGMGGMRDLEAASMRLANAASKREMQESEYKMKLNKALELGYSSIEEMEKKLGRKSFFR
jgi:hypothetical protein